MPRWGDTRFYNSGALAVGVLGNSIAAGVTSSGSFTRVDNYLNEHCPVDSTLAQHIIEESE